MKEFSHGHFEGKNLSTPEDEQPGFLGSNVAAELKVVCSKKESFKFLDLRHNEHEHRKSEVMGRSAESSTAVTKPFGNTKPIQQPMPLGRIHGSDVHKGCHMMSPVCHNSWVKSLSSDEVMERPHVDERPCDPDNPDNNNSATKPQLSVLFPYVQFLQGTRSILLHRWKSLFLVVFVILFVVIVPGFICLAAPMPNIIHGWKRAQLYLLTSIFLIAYQCSLFFDGIFYTYFNYDTFVAFTKRKTRVSLSVHNQSMSNVPRDEAPSVLGQKKDTKEIFNSICLRTEPIASERVDSGSECQTDAQCLSTQEYQLASSVFRSSVIVKVFVISFVIYSLSVVLFVFISIVMGAYPLPMSGPLSVSVTYIPFKCLVGYYYFHRTVRQAIPEESRVRPVVLDFLFQAYVAGIFFTTSTIVFFFISEFTVFTFYKIEGFWQVVLLSTYQVIVLSVKVCSRLISKRNCRVLHIDDEHTAEYSAVWGTWCDYGCQIFVMMSLPSVSDDSAAPLYLTQQSIMILMQPLIDTQTGRLYLIRFMKAVSPTHKHAFIEESMQINETYQRKASLQICCANFISRLTACVTYIIFAYICYYGPNKQYIVPFEDVSPSEFESNIKFIIICFIVAFFEMLLVRKVLFIKYKRDILSDYTEMAANKAILMGSLYTSVLVFTQLAIIAHGNLLLRY